jgi:hypothetical protein
LRIANGYISFIREESVPEINESSDPGEKGTITRTFILLPTKLRAL